MNLIRRHCKLKILSLVSLLICLSTQSTFSQSTLIPEWVLKKSSPLSNGNAEAWAIGSDVNGNLFWGVNKDMPGAFEFMDAFLYKLDSDSNLIWLDTVYTGIYAQQSYNLKVTDSLVYLGGRTCSSIGTDNCDALFVVSDANTGTTGWSFEWDGGYGYEEIDGIAIESDGIYLTGWSAGNGTNIDALLMKIDHSGNIIWQTTWGSNTARDDHQDGHIVVDDSLIYISGLYDGSPGLGWDGYALLAKFDKTNGAFIDSVLYGRQDAWFNAENALGMTSDSNYLYITGNSTVEANNWDLFVAKFDKDFNQMWYETWDGFVNAESARSIAVAADGSIYIGGTSESIGNGGMEIVLLKYTSSGNLEWYKTWGGAFDDQTLDIHIYENNLYMTGKTQSFHPTQKWEAVLLKVGIDSALSINEFTNKSIKELHFSPNPMTSSGILKFNNESNEAHKLNLFDLTGKNVKTIANITTSEVKLKKENLESGLFFFELRNLHAIVGIGKLIIQ